MENVLCGNMGLKIQTGFLILEDEGERAAEREFPKVEAGNKEGARETMKLRFKKITKKDWKVSSVESGHSSTGAQGHHRLRHLQARASGRNQILGGFRWVRGRRWAILLRSGEEGR